MECWVVEFGGWKFVFWGWGQGWVSTCDEEWG